MCSLRKIGDLLFREALQQPFATRDSFPTDWESRNQEGLVVEFASPSGDKWIGNFKPGGGGIDGVRLHPNGVEVLVMTAGSVWSADPFSRNAIELAGSVDGTWPVNDPEGLIFSLQGLAFLRLGPSGILWRTRQISWDGFRHIELSEHALAGEAWSATDDSWIPFGVNLDTGVVTGGSYPESAAR
ncbi:MAG TPA: hypothetical protein VFI56_28410 [Vicinamibacterales bacterium]|nr:hypothetical protein [Vicinamibacterales bacterium]